MTGIRSDNNPSIDDRRPGVGSAGPKVRLANETRRMAHQIAETRLSLEVKNQNQRRKLRPLDAGKGKS